MPDFSSSVFISLEPLIGAAFALNVAYIGLPRFRYRQKMNEEANEGVKKLDGSLSSFENTSWARRLRWLCSLTHGEVKSTKDNRPSESWANHYAWLFENHLDRYLTIRVAAFLGLSLAACGAHSAGHFGSINGFDLMFLFSDASFHAWFAAYVISAIWPVFLVKVGHGVMAGAKIWIDTIINDMLNTRREDILKIPDPGDKVAE